LIVKGIFAPPAGDEKSLAFADRTSQTGSELNLFWCSYGKNSIRLKSKWVRIVMLNIIHIRT